MLLTEAFRRFGATLKNVNWSISSENDKGELVVSLWQQYFDAPKHGKTKYVDRASRWSGHGNTEFRERIENASQSNQPVRAIIARTNDPEAVDKGMDASKLKNTFHPREDWIGRVVLWDGDNFEIEFTREERNA